MRRGREGAGDHPGILLASPPAQILLPNFAMKEKARSNLTQYDGIDLTGGKDYLFIPKPGRPLVEHDFLPDRGTGA